MGHEDYLTGGEAAAEPLAADAKSSAMVQPRLLPAVLGYGLSFLAVAALCGFLFSPWLEKSEAEESRRSELVGTDNLLDCFIVRDVSKSPNSARYDSIQAEILSHLKPRTKDRVSYTQFAGDTFPRRIQPPSQNLQAIEAAMQNVPDDGSSLKTDFALLFNRLREAITLDRRAKKAIKREPHSDVVIILSDGVPDAKGSHRNCPDDFESSGEMFIPRDVRDAYEALVSSKYATNEPLLVYLVLAGENPTCAPQIVQEWQVALGSLGLRVVPSEELPGDPNLGPILFSALERQKGLYLMPSSELLPDEEREKFDRGETFAVEYRVFSQSVDRFLRMRVRRAYLSDDHNRHVTKLFALRDSQESTSEVRSEVRVVVEPPEGKEEIRGPVETVIVFFRFDADEFRHSNISPAESYRVSLIAEDPAVVPDMQPYPVVIIAQDVVLRECSSSRRKQVLESRLGNLMVVSSILAVLFIICLVSFHFFQREMAEKLHVWVHRVVVVPMRLWGMAFVVLLVVFAVGWTVMGRSLAAAIFLAPAMLLWGGLKIYRRVAGHQHSPLLEGCLLAGEFLLLPAAAAVAAEILVKVR